MDAMVGKVLYAVGAVACIVGLLGWVTFIAIAAMGTYVDVPDWINYGCITGVIGGVVFMAIGKLVMKYFKG
jgi:hypothetical protein